MVRYLNAAGHHQNKNVFLFHLAQHANSEHAQYVLKLACELQPRMPLPMYMKILKPKA